MAVLERRSTVALIAPRSRPRFPGPLRGVTAHWNGPAMRLAGKPHSACRQAWRNIQRFHMGKYYWPNPLSSGRHWADVAYTAAVCHHEIVMEGRGPGVRTAANGTSVGNDRWYAIFFMVGGTEEPNSKMLRAAEWYARVHLKTTNWNCHSDHKSTTCAGTVNKYISGGNILTSGKEPMKLGDRILSLQDPMLRGNDVEEWQHNLRKWDRKALPRFGADSGFGGETKDWTKRFQNASGLSTDGVVGPKTRRLMEEALAPKAEPKPKPEPEPGPYPDVPLNHTFAVEIEKARDLGLMLGRSDGTFDPDGAITRAQLAAIAVRLHESLS